MRTVKIAYPLLLLALALPATASAQAPPPDERAAALALADGAQRLMDDVDRAEDALDWTSRCPALERRVPQRHADDAESYAAGLELRSYLDGLRPSVQRLRTDIANVTTADPVLLSGRAAVRRILRAVASVPVGEPDPCAAYKAYMAAGYPPGPAREARALDRRLSTLATPGIVRKTRAAARHMVELGVPRERAEAFRQLAE